MNVPKNKINIFIINILLSYLTNTIMCKKIIFLVLFTLLVNELLCDDDKIYFTDENGNVIIDQDDDDTTKGKILIIYTQNI